MMARGLVIILPGGSSRRIILGGKSQRFRNFRMIRRFRSSRGIRRLRKFRKFRRFRSEKGARVAPRRDVRRFRIDFWVDFRCFSRLHCASALPGSVKCRTLILTGRRSTLERFCILRKTQKSTKIVESLLRKRCASAAHAKNSLFWVPEAPRRRF